MVVEDRLSPHDIASEEGVVGSLLIDGQAIKSIVSELNPSDFYHAPLQVLFTSCLDLYHRGSAIDQITLAQELDRQGKLGVVGGVGYLMQLTAQVPTSLDIGDYAKTVHNLSVSRQIIQMAKQCEEIGFQANPNSGESIDKIYQLISDFKKNNLKTKSLVTPKMAADVVYELIREYNEPDHYLKWGFRDLDEITSGIYPSELIIIGSRPSVGKSQLMLDIAERLMCYGKRVLFCSVEMSMKHILERKVSRVLQTDIRALRANGVDSKQQESIVTLAGQISESNIYYMPQGVSSSEIHSEAAKLKDDIGLDIIFIDYLQFLKDCWQTERENQNVRVGKACKTLKTIANDLGVPVIVASQLNRQLEYRSQDTKRPTLADLRDSGNIEQDADVVLLLHRNEANDSLLEVKMAKNRQLGAAKAIVLQWDNLAHGYGDYGGVEPAME